MRRLRDQWFLMGMLAITALVLWNPGRAMEAAGRELARFHANEWGIALIFLCSGLELHYESMLKAIRNWKGTTLALAAIFAWAPFLAWCLSHLTSSPQIQIGLFLIGVVPTTLASGVVMSEAAGGEVAHALLITVLANLLCILTIPAELALMLPAGHVSIHLPYTEMTLKLAGLVLAPLLFGMALQRPFSIWLDRLPFRPSLLSRVVILTIIFLGLSKGRESILGGGAEALEALGLASALHLALAGILWVTLKALQWKPGQRESIFFMGIQKTLPLSIWLQTTYFTSYGLALVVCVFYHLMQLIADSYFVGLLSKLKKQPFH